MKSSLCPSHPTRRSASMLILSVALLGLMLSACTRENASSSEAVDPAVSVKSSQGPVTITMSAEPGTVQLSRDTLLRILISAPSEMEVIVPDLTDRAQGFMISGQYERDPQSEAGRTQREIQVRLTPMIADHYRIAPIAITYLDKSSSPPTEAWFATQALRLILKVRAAQDDATDWPVGIDFERQIDPLLDRLRHFFRRAFQE